MSALGKQMAHCLRHSPETYHVNMTEDGSVYVEHLALALRVTVAQLMQEVRSDDKGRFGLKKDAMGYWKVYARQGHSIAVTIPMPRIQEVILTPGIVYHGTKTKNMESILANGLVPNGRDFVHLSLEESVARTVAGRRKGETTILRVDLPSMLFEGAEVFLSENRVVLTKHVPTRFLSVKL